MTWHDRMITQNRTLIKSKIQSSASKSDTGQHYWQFSFCYGFQSDYVMPLAMFTLGNLRVFRNAISEFSLYNKPFIQINNKRGACPQLWFSGLKKQMTWIGKWILAGSDALVGSLLPLKTCLATTTLCVKARHRAGLPKGRASNP